MESEIVMIVNESSARIVDLKEQTYRCVEIWDENRWREYINTVRKKRFELGYLSTINEVKS